MACRSSTHPNVAITATTTTIDLSFDGNDHGGSKKPVSEMVFSATSHRVTVSDIILDTYST